MTEPVDDTIDLAHYRDVLRRRRWFLVLAPLLSALVALTLAQRSEDTFRASALLRVEGENIDTDVELLTTNALEDAVEASLGERADGIDDVSASRVGETQLIELSITSASAELAAEAANTWVEAYQQRRLDDLTVDLRDERDSLRDEADALSSQIVASQTEAQELQQAIETAQENDDDAFDLAATQARLAALQADQVRLEALQQDLEERALTIDTELFDVQRSVTVQDEAKVPGGPFSPRPLRSAVVGLFAGLLIGVIAAAVAELIDDPIADEADAERWSGGHRVIATIPSAPASRRDEEPGPITLRDPHHPATDAYRMLWTSLQYLAIERRMDRIMITSAESGEGKTFTSVNLAITAARAGTDTVLVDSDLRLGSVGSTLGMTTGMGLAQVLAEQAEVQDCLVPVWVGGSAELDVLQSGKSSRNPAELISTGSAMEAVLRRLGLRGATLIVDTPPMLAVSETMSTARHVSSVLVVVRAGVTRGRALRQAVNRAEQAGLPIVGLVLNDDRRKLSASAYRYATPNATRNRTGRPDSATRD